LCSFGGFGCRATFCKLLPTVIDTGIYICFAPSLARQILRILFCIHGLLDCLVHSEFFKSSAVALRFCISEQGYTVVINEKYCLATVCLFIFSFFRSTPLTCTYIASTCFAMLYDYASDELAFVFAIYHSQMFMHPTVAFSFGLPVSPQ
jgi:hypothetical protein